MKILQGPYSDPQRSLTAFIELTCTFFRSCKDLKKDPYDPQGFNNDLNRILFSTSFKILKRLTFARILKYPQRFNEDLTKIFSEILQRSFCRSVQDLCNDPKISTKI